jgi:predicted nucleotidyltransferase
MFQGMLNMDRSERCFKLGLDLLALTLLTPVFHLRLSGPKAIGLGLLAAHSLNFFCNGQIYAVLKTFGYVQRTQESYQCEVARLSNRIEQQPDILFAAAYGSLARGQWSPTSDLDVRLVRAPGLPSALRVCWFALRERARAFWRRFPLDLYVLDSYASLDKLVERDVPVILGRAQAEQIKDGKSDDTT